MSYLQKLGLGEANYDLKPFVAVDGFVALKAGQIAAGCDQGPDDALAVVFQLAVSQTESSAPQSGGQDMGNSVFGSANADLAGLIDGRLSLDVEKKQDRE